MDITQAFCAAVPEAESARSSLFAPSPVVLRCLDLLRQIENNESYLGRVYEDFVGYHSAFHGLSGGSGLSEDEQSRLGQEVAVFIAGALSDVQELRRISRYGGASSAQMQHYDAILSQLTKRLERFSKISKKMQRERERWRELSPFRLHGHGSGSDHGHLQLLAQASPSPAVLGGGAGGGGPSAKFAERYESEVARPALLRRLDDVAARQKASLLREAAHLTQAFGEELSLATSAEASVENISSMLTDFMGILSEQSEQLGDVSAYGKTTTDSVEQTGKELQLTIDRTESHSRNMALLAVSLALILLLLDFITP